MSSVCHVCYIFGNLLGFQAWIVLLYYFKVHIGISRSVAFPCMDCPTVEFPGLCFPPKFVHVYIVLPWCLHVCVVPK